MQEFIRFIGLDDLGYNKTCRIGRLDFKDLPHAHTCAFSAGTAINQI